MRNFMRYQAPALLWMVFIFTLSAVPGSNVPNLFPYFHPAVHFVEYSVLAFLCLRALHRKRPDLNFALLAAGVWGFVILFSASDEWHQTFIGGRTGQIRDVLFDSFYAWFGIGLFLRLKR